MMITNTEHELVYVYEHVCASTCVNMHLIMCVHLSVYAQVLRC